MDMKDKALELWDFLATTGERSKLDAYHILGFAPDINDCPMCEVAAISSTELDDGEICEKCPLYNRWHGRNHSDHETCMDSGTYNGDTFVQLWHQARTKISRQVYARTVHHNILKEWKTELDEHEG